ncbi:MAG: hypothetical protein ACJA2P_002480 [Rhodoferax sp.]|jgi:hypothetical protein
MSPTLAPLTLSQVDDLIYRVLTASGAHVGNLKWINGVWKLKAIGYDTDGSVIPGGGPLTERHNTHFLTLDLALINGRLAPDLGILK